MSIQNLMEQASKAYYDGEPFISNEEYDALERINGQIICGSWRDRAYLSYVLS